jgi:exopolysaccharide production protein ExoQ
MRDDRHSALRRPSGLNVARPPSSPAAVAPRARSDRPYQVVIATVLYWLVIVRVVIPGFFDYGANLDAVEIAEKYATFSTVTWLTFLFVPCLLLASRTKQLLRVFGSMNRWFLFLVAFATISVAWTIETHSTISRITHLWAIILASLAVVLVGWDSFRVQHATRPILTLLLVGSLIFGLAAPDLAITPPLPPDTRYYWHGLAAQKNGLGSLAALGALFWFHGWISREVKFLPALCGWLVAIACLVLSRSSTSVMATVFASLLVLMLTRTAPSMRRYMPFIIACFVAVVLAYACAVLKLIPALDFLLEPVTALSGKDLTFTGRTQIWDIIREHIQLAPVLGTGYGGYWSGPVPTSPSYVFLHAMYFYPSEAHNGYLDVVNDLGFVGLILLIGYIIVYITQSLRLWRVDRAQASLYIALMFQQMLANLSETHWLFIGDDFIVLTLATCGLARSLMKNSPARPNVAPAKPNTAPAKTNVAAGGWRSHLR